ncbi:MAG: biotin--[acetyl-CoA-carboxylase] ligase [Alphaproteobacteria bacterium]|nr:biotin--[acetyl-CoA-carboxylase] ligase [Alphaproteobacteria bacterium]
MPRILKEWLWIDYPSVSSTNDIAKNYKTDNKEEKVLITAEEQVKGRGRRGRTWISAKGNLFMSLLFSTKVSPSDIAFVTSLSIAQTLKKADNHLNVNIKWPNDILINGKKVSGILIEVGESGIVVGIGINLVCSPAQSETIYTATNLKDEGIDISRESFLEKMLDVFADNLKKCEISGLQAIREDWLNFAYNLHNSISIRQGNNFQSGIFMGIDEQGFLLLKQQNKIEKISVGDIIE